MPGPRIVWLSGCSGAGKTFLADYLERVPARADAFTHVDGDALMFSAEPADRELTANFRAAFAYWFKEEPAPPHLWQPYYAAACARARAAAAAAAAADAGSGACLGGAGVSLTVFPREVRDFLRAELPEHVFILLRVPPDELVRRARQRFAAYAEARGQSPAEAWAALHGGAALTDAVFERSTRDIMRGLQPLGDDELRAGRSHELVVGDDGAPWHALHALLGLPPPPAAVPVAEIAEINYARFRAYAVQV